MPDSDTYEQFDRSSFQIDPVRALPDLPRPNDCFQELGQNVWHCSKQACSIFLLFHRMHGLRTMYVQGTWLRGRDQVLPVEGGTCNRETVLSSLVSKAIHVGNSQRAAARDPAAPKRARRVTRGRHETQQAVNHMGWSRRKLVR